MPRFLSRLRKDRAALFLFLTALFAAITCALRSLSFFVGFDADIGYFRASSPIVIISGICMLLCIGFGAAVSFLINIGNVPSESEPLSAPRFVAATVSAILLCVTALFVIFRASKIPAPALLVLLTGICMLGSAVYFLLRLRNGKAAAFGFFTIFAPAMMLAVTYFDRYTQMNAPHKVWVQLSLLSIMIYTLYELRARIGRPAPRALAVASALLLMLCIPTGVSDLIAYACNLYDDALYLICDLVLTAFAVYVACRTITTLRSDLPDCEKQNTEDAE